MTNAATFGALSASFTAAANVGRPSAVAKLFGDVVTAVVAIGFVDSAGFGADFTSDQNVGRVSQIAEHAAAFATALDADGDLGVTLTDEIAAFTAQVNIGRISKIAEIGAAMCDVLADIPDA